MLTQFIKAYRTCAHYRGQVISSQPIARIAFTVWRVNASITRWLNRSLERQPIPAGVYARRIINADIIL